jgi:GAF domain-containing protein
MTPQFRGATPQQAFDELASIAAGGFALSEVLTRTAALAKQVLPLPIEASVTVIDGTATTPAFTATIALELDEAQYALGYGPCLASAEAGQRVVIPDMSAEDRWPDFAGAALDRGIHSSLSVPLPVQRQAIGSLNLYSTAEPGGFGHDVIALAEGFGTYAAVAIANTTLYMSAAELAEHMAAAMASRAAIEQAKGILMSQRKCDADEAFHLLVKLSQQTHRKLRDVAATLIEHTLTA